MEHHTQNNHEHNGHWDECIIPVSDANSDAEKNSTAVVNITVVADMNSYHMVTTWTIW